MTTASPPAVVPQQKPSPRKGRRASAALWVMALAVTVPGAAPIAHLVWTVLRP